MDYYNPYNVLKIIILISASLLFLIFGFGIYFALLNIINKKNSLTANGKLICFATKLENDRYNNPFDYHNYNSKSSVPVFKVNYNNKDFVPMASVYHKSLSEEDIGKEFKVRIKVSSNKKSIDFICLDDDEILKFHNRFYTIVSIVLIILELLLVLFSVYFYLKLSNI